MVLPEAQAVASLQKEAPTEVGLDPQQPQVQPSLSALSVSSTSFAIDPDQLLATCYKIKENIDQLDKGIRLARLRLTSLVYIGPTLGQRSNNSTDETLSFKCFDDLLDLSRLSYALVSQLEELHRKFRDNTTENPISCRIAAQQLIYFTSEWHDNLTPKFNEILVLAERVDQDLKRRLDNHKPTIASRSAARDSLQTMNSIESRVHDSLLRLRKSMGENERLINDIASNVESTRETIDSIYKQLATTKVNLDASDAQMDETLVLVRESQRCSQIICFILFIVIGFVLLFIYKLLF